MYIYIYIYTYIYIYIHTSVDYDVGSAPDLFLNAGSHEGLHAALQAVASEVLFFPARVG